MKSDICVVGGINMDLVVHVPHIPRPGETVQGGDVARFPGGKGSNQAVAASRLGAAVAMLGQVGSEFASGAIGCRGTPWRSSSCSGRSMMSTPTRS